MTFTFIRLPVTWSVISCERLKQLRAEQLRATARKSGRELTPDEVRRVLDPIATKRPVLYGELNEIDSLDAKVLKELNGWHWRDEFFRLPRGNTERLALFLREVGAWPGSGEPNPYAPGHALLFPLVVQPDDVWSFRDDLMDALLDRNKFKEAVAPARSRPRTWLELYAPKVKDQKGTEHLGAPISANDFQLRLELSDVAAGVVTLTNASHMLFATVLADVARGIRFKICKRNGCQIPLAITSKHKRSYHSRECAHLALVQRKRSKEKREKRKGTLRKSLR